MRSFIHGVVLAGLVGSIAVASWEIRGRYDDGPMKAASDRALYWQRVATQPHAGSGKAEASSPKTGRHERARGGEGTKPATSPRHHHRQPSDTGEADRLNRAEAE